MGDNATNILYCCFSQLMYTLTRNQISTYTKLNLSLTGSIYLVVLPLEMQKRLKQTKVYHMFFHFVWKEKTHKPLKVAAAKPLFSSECVIGKTCFDECFLFHIITGRYFFRSSHRRCSMKKGVLGNFAKFTGKHLCQSLFLKKITGLSLQLY